MAKKLNIQSMRRAVEEAGDQRDQERAATHLMPKLEEAIADLRGQIGALTTEFQDGYFRRYLKPTTSTPYVIQPEYTMAVAAAGAAFLAIVLDGIVSGLLSKDWFNFSQQVSIMAGGLTSICLSLFSKTGVGMATRAHDVLAPRATRRKLEATGIASLVANFVLFVLLLLSRNPSDDYASFIFTLAGSALGLLGITLPVFAGALMIYGLELDWSRRLFRKWQAARDSLAELQGLLDWCSDLATEPEAIPEGAGHLGEPQVTA